MIVGAAVTYDMKHKAENAARRVAASAGPDRQGEGSHRRCSRPSGACSPSRAACRRSSRNTPITSSSQPFSLDQMATIDEIPLKPVMPDPEQGREDHRRHRRRRDNPVGPDGDERDRTRHPGCTPRSAAAGEVDADAPASAAIRCAGASGSRSASSRLAYLALIGRLVMFGIIGPAAAGGGYDANAAHRHQPAGPRRPQRRDPGDRHQDGVALRRAAQHPRSRRGDRADHQRAARPRRRPPSARSSPTNAGFVWLQARDHARAAGADPRARHSRHRLPPREHAASIRAARPPRTSSASSTSTTRASPASRNMSTTTASRDLHTAGFARGEDLEPVQAVDRPPRPAHPARRARRRDGPLQGDRRDRRRARRAHRRSPRDGVAARLRPQQSGRCARSPIASTA